MIGLAAAAGDGAGTLLARDAAATTGDNRGDVMTDFAAAVHDWPDHAAIRYADETVSYREFAEMVRVTAFRYRAHRFGGRGSSSLIGTLVSHTPAVAEQMFGVLAAGAAYCPIDADLPPARRRELAEAIGLRRVFPSSGDAREITTSTTETPVPLPHPADPAYVLCTSGSTGAPKPVVVSRRALTVTVRALRSLFAITPDDRVLQFASLGWDTCLEEILPALTAGAALVFDDAAHSHSFPKFVRMLERQAVTVLDLPTAFWHELVLFLDEERAALPDCVRLVVIGGERIDPTRLRQWRRLDLGHISLLNTYGCTETTMVTHAVQLSGPGTEPAVAADDADAPIGRALPHVRDHVTAEGELLVAGDGLATGYLGRPELSTSAFPVVDHGWGPVRWFRTGDLVRRGEDGLLYSRGRTDEQVKVLGVRVHPAEVEAHLNTHPAVKAAVVLAVRSLGRTALDAYVVPIGEVTPGEVRRYLQARLPSQLVPSRVTFVPALTYTASGKVDRTAMQRAAAGHEHIPENPLGSKGAAR
jgi:amino acid adenylation domain-containing protein